MQLLFCFMLVRQFAGNFLQNLCVSTKMRFPAYFWGEILKKLLQFLFQSGMLYPTKAKLGYILTLEHLLRLRVRLCFFLAIFFIYLLIIYPACPARDEKSDDPPARVVAFSFVCGCPLGWDAPECPLSIFSGKSILTQNRALPGGNALLDAPIMQGGTDRSARPWQGHSRPRPPPDR